MLTSSDASKLEHVTSQRSSVVLEGPFVRYAVAGSRSVSGLGDTRPLACVCCFGRVGGFRPHGALQVPRGLWSARGLWELRGNDLVTRRKGWQTRCASVSSCKRASQLALRRVISCASLRRETTRCTRTSRIECRPSASRSTAANSIDRNLLKQFCSFRLLHLVGIWTPKPEFH